MDGLLSEIAGLSLKQRTLLEMRLQRRRSSGTDQVTPRPPELTEIPLSFAQERMWLLDRILPGNPAYHVHYACRIEGPLDVAALRRSAEEVVRRHEVLRTTYVERDGGPMQRVRPPFPVPIPVVDLSSCPHPRAEARRLMVSEGQRPFDLAHGPILRMLLLRSGDAEHVLLWALHHIASDQWSMAILQSEILTLYAAFSEAVPSPLPELGVQYADFALWQRRHLQGERTASLLTYWKNRLSGAPPALDLPADRPRPAVLSAHGEAQQLRLSPALSRELESLALRHGATLYMVLLTAFRTLLARYAGQDDLSIGMPMAQRRQLELEPLIGFFVNTLVVRTRNARHLGFRQALAQVKDAVLDAHAHQELPFEKLVAELQLERNIAQSPLFQVLFVLQNAPREIPAANVVLTRIMLPEVTAKFDLSLALEADGAGGLSGILEYSSDLFDRTTIARLAGHFGRLLAAVVADPEVPLLEIPLWGEAEHQQVLWEWNDTRLSGLDGFLLHQLIESQVARRPQAIAAVSDRGTLTYGELNGRANRLARSLRKLDMGPERIVGVCLERSLELVIALLGTLKSGAAYIPLDPGMPSERLASILAEADVQVVITDAGAGGGLAETGVHLVEIGPGGEALPPGPDGDLGVKLDPASLAYAIYTSGSTGKPKGAMNTHDAICNRLLWMQARYRLTPEDRVLQKTSFSFDVSVWEFFWPLLTGASLVLAEPGGHRDATYLARLVAQQRVTTMHFVPSMLPAFLEALAPGQGTSLRQVLCSGEALSRELKDRFFAVLGCELHNLYGPTEAAIDVTAEACSPLSSAVTPPIGRPISNLRIHILDPEDRLVPIGVPGELYIGGAGLARGYIARPDLTAEKFVPDPCGEQPGARLYRSGDRARHLPDGRIEYLGRLDHQLKIRGFRIEPGEIELALQRHPEVREAVVVEDARQGTKRLVAYLVPVGQLAPRVADLVSLVRGVLPEYMVPAAFVFLDEIPLTSSGKIDRRSLPAPDDRRPHLSTEAEGPRTLTQELLVGIWSEVLRVEGIGVRDDFFELGGHSLTGTQVLSRVRKTFRVDLPLRSLLEAPTIERFGEIVERARRADDTGDVPPLRMVPRSSELPLSFAQERFWLLDQMEPGNSAYNLGEAFRLRGPLSLAALTGTLSEVVRRHEALRTTFAMMDGRPVQVIGPALPFPAPMIDLSALPADAAESLARQLLASAAGSSFDLSRGPLLRALLLRLAAEGHVLSLIAHHIIADGWSLDLLRNELVALYDAHLASRPPALPEPTVQYADFAVWQRSWLHSEILERQMLYWRRQLAGSPPLLELPTDRPRPPLQSYRGATESHALPPFLAVELRRLARQRRVTPFILLLASFATLLHRSSGQEDLSIGVPAAGRTRSELEGLIGLLVNTLVLRARLAADPSFDDLLAQVRETSLEAQAHQELPFEKLVEELRPERSLSHSPLFQVMFIFRILPRGWTGSSGLELSPYPIEDRTSKFDLTLGVIETPEGFAGALEYSVALFDRTTILRLWEQFGKLLLEVVTDPARPLSALPLLSAAERYSVIVEANDTWISPPLQGVHRLFEGWAARTPDAAALETDGEVLSYGELNRRSNRLARRLRRLGIAPELRVGFCTERSAAMVVGLLGLLKAGGCYVPLDPTYPRERLAATLEDAAPSLVLTEDRFRELLPTTAPVLSLPVLLADLGGEASEDLEDGPWSEHLAYILFTSGSTGRPKGVQIPHGALANFLMSMRVRPGLSPGDRLLAVTSLSFDIAGLELYLPLITGACVVLADRSTAADGALLAARLYSSGAQVMQATAATWRLLLDAGWPGADGFRVLCGGEALPRSLADRLRGRAVEVWNLYGPTETTIWSSVHRVDEGTSPLVSIGRPIDNTSLILLDRRFQPVGVGIPGEVCIGGDGLARGYLAAPALTADRFIPNPWCGSAGGRLYRTGDLARRLPDGEIEFLSRLDYQVKVRGFRIELGEVEAALVAHPEIEAAVAVVHTDRAGDRRLVVYGVPAVGTAPAVDALLAFVRGRLPGYMVPSTLLLLPVFPLAPNGKVDRKALPAPEWGRDAAGAPFVEPRTRLERTIAAAWVDLLALSALGVHDNFFALGGHSLLAAHLVYKLQEVCGAPILLRHLFEAPTVAGLAVLVAQLSSEAVSEGLPPILPSPDDRYQPFPLTDVQQAYWLGRSGSFALGNVASHSYSELDASGLDLSRLETVLQRLVERHDMLRAIVLPDGNQQVLTAVPPFRIEVQDLASLDPATAEARMLDLRTRMSHQVLPADRWPLFEIKASRLASKRLRLHVSLDFLIADAWSTEILKREIGILYSDPGADLPPLELSFRDCVLAELAWRDGQPYQRASRYWSERLATLPPAPELPMARNAGSQAPRFTRREARLDRERWRHLREQAGKAGITPSGVLLAAFSEVLRAWSKKSRFTLNLTLFNRPPLHSQIQSVVGDFTSLTLLAVEDPGPSTSFEQRARALQGQLFRDLDERLVSGIEVLRRINRQAGEGQRALMPVVFTSTLDLGPSDGKEPEEAGEATAGDFAYGITQTPQVWLDHQVAEIFGALVFNWDTVEEFFPDGMIDAMFTAYRRLLERLAEDPASWLDERPLRLPTEQLAARLDANETASAVVASTLHGLFEKQVVRCPSRLAVVDGVHTLTYGELERRANGLAGRLREHGAGRNRLVAVLMEKGWEQVVSVMAILKSGAAYLPIDPKLPRERILQLLALGDVELALVRSGQDAALTLPPRITGLSVTSDAAEATSPPPVAHDAEALCYVIFTSGSTGVPKGVMIDHQGAVNTVLDLNHRFGIGPEDRVLALSSLSFDLSVYDIFGLLAAGGAVVMPDAGTQRDPAHWAERIASQQVTVWNSVPALLEMLVEHSASQSSGRLGSLRLALLSGDWIPVTLPDRFRALVPDARVISLGGATEASIWSIFYPIQDVDPSWTSIPYGKPLTNQRFHVLGPDLEPRPVWVPGDLYIGGIGLARGYWRDPEKTRASFVEHPRTGEALYRTGDLGRYLPDGNIEFLGREDDQVKIQGFRIELGEIEASLEKLPEVRTAVVTTAGTDRLNRRLVAYVVPRETRSVAAALPGEDAVSRRLRRFDQRRTHRAFDPSPLAGEWMAHLLFSLSQVRLQQFPLPKYLYPSAGNLYPVQTYLQVQPNRIEGLAPGLYYYHPKLHRLILVAAGPLLDRTAYAEVNRPVFDGAAFAVLLVSRMAAISPVYGELAWDFSVLEAGYMGELLMETAAASGIGLCPIGDLDFAGLRPQLFLDGNHRLVHSFLGGPLMGANPISAAPEMSEPVVAPTSTSVSKAPAEPGLEQRLSETELLDFKLSEPGLRRDLGGGTGLSLAIPAESGREPFLERRSHREFLAAPVGRGRLEELLAALAPELTDGGAPQYRYPSAGDLYTLRAYVHVKPGRADGLEAGIYRYDPHRRALLPVTPGAGMDHDVHAEVNQLPFDQAAFSLFLIAKTGAVTSRYGDLARNFCLLEAGYMGQLLMTVAPDSGLGLCPIGSLDFARIAGLFQLAPDQVLVHCLLGGAVAQGDGSGATARAGQDALPEILRQRLLEKLPEYMVPAAWVVLDALPLSSNGKVDRRALPDPDQALTGATHGEYAAPDSDLGRLIAGIWQEELQVDRIGMDDNFFELGGNSLHMVRVQARLSEALGREIRITELFKHSTVRTMAQNLGARATPTRPAFDSLREQADKQRRVIERQRQRRQEKANDEQ